MIDHRGASTTERAHIVDVLHGPVAGELIVRGMTIQDLVAALAAYPELTVRHLGLTQVKEVSKAALTERELDVLRLIAAGYSNVEVADKVCLSINTIKSHIRVAYRKMNVETRSQAVLWAVRHGLVEPDVVT